MITNSEMCVTITRQIYAQQKTELEQENATMRQTLATIDETHSSYASLTKKIAENLLKITAIEEKSPKLAKRKSTAGESDRKYNRAKLAAPRTIDFDTLLDTYTTEAQCTTATALSPLEIIIKEDINRCVAKIAALKQQWHQAHLETSELQDKVKHGASQILTTHQEHSGKKVSSTTAEMFKDLLSEQHSLQDKLALKEHFVARIVVKLDLVQAKLNWHKAQLASIQQKDEERSCHTLSSP